MSTADKAQQRRREDLRRDVLAFLAQRAPTAPRTNAIRKWINADMDTDYSAEETETALAFLEGLKLVECIKDPLGTNHGYRTTAEGILQYERNQP